MPIKSSDYHNKAIGQLKRYSSLCNLQRQNSHSLQQKTYLNNKNPQISNKRPKFIPFCQQRDLGNLISQSMKQKGIFNTNDLSNKRKQMQKIINYVNFKNFKKIYNQQKNIQQKMYAKMTRIPDQIDILKNDQWIVKNIRNKVKQLNSKNRQSLVASSVSTSRLQNSIIRRSPPSKFSHYNNLESKLRSNHSLSINTQESKLLNNRSIQLSKNLKKSINSTNLTNQNNQIPNHKNKFQKIDIQLYKKIAANCPPDSKNQQLNQFFRHYVQICELNQNLRREELTLIRKSKVL